MAEAKKIKKDEGKDLAQQVLSLLLKYEIATTPDNYQLFHAYAAGENPSLGEEMKALMDQGGFTQETCDALHNKYFSGIDLTDQALRAGGKFGTEMNSVLRMLAAAERNTVEYEKTLSGAADMLESSGDTKSLKTMVDTLLAATANMQRHTQTLETRLNKTTDEVQALRDNLELVRTEAMTDALTGVANRKRFDEFMRRHCAAAEGDGQELSLVFCDIDHFKRFNDTWGHQTGDQIIRFVAGCLQRSANKSHLVARYGGEEFAVIMPTTDIQTAFDIADNVRATVESKTLLRKSTNEDLGTVTISMGVATYEQGMSVEELIERADSALYRSKHAGRNKVTLDPGTQSGLSAA